MTIEDIEKQLTVRGERVSEILLIKPNVKINDEGKTVIDIEDDKYAADVLVFPEFEISKDDESEVFEKKSESDEIVADPTQGMGDDEFDALFN